MATRRTADIIGDATDGRRPSKSLAIAMAIALEEAGITEVEELPRGMLMSFQKIGMPIRDMVSNVRAGKKWCCWHHRFEDQSKFSSDERSVCREGSKNYDRGRK